MHLNQFIHDNSMQLSQQIINNNKINNKRISKTIVKKQYKIKTKTIFKKKYK